MLFFSNFIWLFLSDYSDLSKMCFSTGLDVEEGGLEGQLEPGKVGL